MRIVEYGSRYVQIKFPKVLSIGSIYLDYPHFIRQSVSKLYSLAIELVKWSWCTYICGSASVYSR